MQRTEEEKLVSKLPRRFWIYLRLAIFFAIVTAFFAYSVFEMQRMVAEGFLSDKWNRLDWYHPAVFWMQGCGEVYVFFFGYDDPAACSNFIGRTMYYGLTFLFSATLAMVVLAGRELFHKSEHLSVPGKSIVSKQPVPWYLVPFTVFFGLLACFGILCSLLLSIFYFGLGARVYYPVVSLVLICVQAGGFLLLCTLGLFRMKKWGFWGLFGSLLVFLLSGFTLGAPLLINVVNLFWLGLLLLVVLAGGQKSVWKQLV